MYALLEYFYLSIITGQAASLICLEKKITKICSIKLANNIELSYESIVM